MNLTTSSELSQTRYRIAELILEFNHPADYPLTKLLPSFRDFQWLDPTDKTDISITVSVAKAPIIFQHEYHFGKNHRSGSCWLLKMFAGCCRSRTVPFLSFFERIKGTRFVLCSYLLRMRTDRDPIGN
ncbi:hypothetical protein [Sphingobacterium sp. G1-14]|uniref:hypothetical protein n=1 Tax=Sphingobacterium sp. G1-14 TaxID=2003121 RepID=UPI000B492B60|nr:hypothetical protein [Sphingobacterium sp. G1-14]